MAIINITGYKFINLDDVLELQKSLRAKCSELGILGTILLSKQDGINILLAAPRQAIDAIVEFIHADVRFADIEFKYSESAEAPFQRLKVKIKPEIITMKDPSIQPQQETVTHLSAEEFKQWLDEKRDITVLDTRNNYEIEGFGTFDDAIDLDIDTFREFPAAAGEQLSDELHDKPLVMFCTGGVRCEKAGPVLAKQGFKEVYQLDGGILRYFEKCGGAHYHGSCFVFDDRIALNPDLQQVQFED